MPSPDSTADDHRNAEQSSADSADSFETFQYDAAAAGATVPPATTAAHESNQPPVPHIVVAAASGKGRRKLTRHKPGASTVSSDGVEVEARGAKATVATARSKGGIPYWLVSLMLHAVLLGMLSLFTLANIPKGDDFSLWASDAAVEEVEEFTDLEIDTTAPIDEFSEELPAELQDPAAAALDALATDDALADVVADATLTSTSMGDLGMLFGADGTGLTEVESGGPTGAAASFFGTKAEGQRVLFMLDNSGSMRDGRMETLVDELLATVNSLRAKQQFYVVFYSDTVYPLFFPTPAEDFVRATKKNKQRLAAWLATVELCGGNAVDDAMRAAEAARPDVVFMLSDGDVQTTPSGRKFRYLLQNEGRRFVVHTLGMDCKTDEHRQQLLQIAEAHGGTFQEVAVNPAMEQLARQNPRPYRKSQNPGPVWGTSFSR